MLWAGTFFQLNVRWMLCNKFLFSFRPFSKVFGEEVCNPDNKK